MESTEIRKRFLEFFQKRGHKILPSSSLVPLEIGNTQNVLFTTAGMQQFKSYYGAPENAIKDFGIKNVTTSQKCVRTGDIDEVGDNTHCTFFEMLGNFSFGGYGRKEAIEYAFEFITKELGLEISYVTYYKGEGIVPKDEESKNIWKSLGISDIREDGKDVFWGPTGLSGPCGPTTEIYCKNANGEDVEIWNIVFNEYFCDGSREQLDKGEAKLTKSEILGIDTGMGFERLLATVQNKKSIYETDLFSLIFKNINLLRNYSNIGSGFDIYAHESDPDYHEKVKVIRIIADHIRTSVFMIADGVVPSNNQRGYILRRLLRRAIRYSNILDFKNNSLFPIAEAVILKYKEIYIELEKHLDAIKEEIIKEEIKFKETLEKGTRFLLSEIEQRNKNKNRKAEIEGGVFKITNDNFNGKWFASFYQTYGYPFELAIEELLHKGIKFENLDKLKNDFNTEMEKHQKLSQTASAGMFKGGLANHNEKTVRLHTAHHLLLASLQEMFGKEVKQRGSNITEERLRMDFTFDRKLTDEEKKKLENSVNEKIKQHLNVICREMPLAEAEKLGAEMEFGAKYPEMVSVYFIGNINPSEPHPDPLLKGEGESCVSIEFCGGPHVSNTSELGHFKILKEEASSQGVRRIKAILE